MTKREEWETALFELVPGEEARDRLNDLYAALEAENAKLRDLVCHLYYVKPRDISALYHDGKVLQFDDMMAEVGLRWESV